MKHIKVNMALNGGRVRQELECEFFGRVRPSRGFYICDESGRWYLHHDGVLRDGVGSKSEKPAFWPTEKEAQDFYDNWKDEALRDLSYLRPLPVFQKFGRAIRPTDGKLVDIYHVELADKSN